MIWDRRYRELSAGANRVEWSSVPATIDATRVTLVSLSAADGVEVESGELTAGTDEQGATLTWRVAAEKPARHLLEAAYTTELISWQARYSLTVAASGSRGRFAGVLEITNHGHQALRDVRLRVTEASLAPAGESEGESEDERSDDRPAGDEKAPLLVLDQPVQLAARSTVLVPLVETGEVVLPVARQLLYDPGDRERHGRSREPERARSFGMREGDDIRPEAREVIALDLSSARGAQASRLAGLPSGWLSIATREVLDGTIATRHIGAGTAFSDRLDGDRTFIELGDARGVEVARRQTEFFLDEHAHRLVEEIRISLRNRQERERVFVVYEHLYRGSNWTVGYHNDIGDPHKVGPQTVRFQVPLPAGGQRTIVYRAIYTW